MEDVFESLHSILTSVGININIVSPDNCIPETDYYTCTINELSQMTYQHIYFNKITKLVHTEIFQNNIFYINNLPSTYSIPKTMSIPLPWLLCSQYLFIQCLFVTLQLACINLCGVILLCFYYRVFFNRIFLQKVTIIKYFSTDYSYTHSSGIMYFLSKQ